MEQQANEGWGQEVHFDPEPSQVYAGAQSGQPYGSESPRTHPSRDQLERKRDYGRHSSYDGRDDYERRGSYGHRERHESREPYHRREDGYPKRDYRGSRERSDDRYEKRYKRDYPHSAATSRRVSPAELAKEPTFLGLKKFLEFQESHIGEQDAFRLYAEYKQQYLKIQLAEFYQAHKNDAWFCELFDAALLTRKRAEVHKMMEAELKVFTEQYNDGYFKDCSLDEHASNEVIPTSEQPEENNLISYEHRSADAKIGIGEGEQQAEFVDSPDSLQGDSSVQTEIIPEQIKRTFIEPLSYPCLLVRNIPPHLPRTELGDAIKQVAEYKALLLSEATVAKSFNRDGWIFFENDIDVDKLYASFENGRLKVSDQISLEICICPQTAKAKIRTCPEVTKTPEQLARDLSLAVAICTKFCKETELQCPFNMEEMLQVQETNLVAQNLDIIITYLRRVHFFCFYCGIQAESTNELIQRCGNAHIRKAQSMKSRSSLDEWLRRHEATLQALLGESETFSKSLPNPLFPAKSVDDEIANLTLQVDAEKFRCILCNKMFKGPEFVDKHIRLKHPEKLQELESNVNIYLNYASNFYRLQQFIPQYFAGIWSYSAEEATALFQRPTLSSRPPEYQRERRDFGRPMHPQVAEPSGRNQYEGRRVKTYADLDAPAPEQDVQLFY